MAFDELRVAVHVGLDQGVVGQLLALLQCPATGLLGTLLLGGLGLFPTACLGLLPCLFLLAGALLRQTPLALGCLIGSLLARGFGLGFALRASLGLAALLQGFLLLPGLLGLAALGGLALGALLGRGRPLRRVGSSRVVR